MTDTKDSFCTIDYYGKIGRGKSKHRPRNDAVLFGGKYPFIQTGDVKHANFYITNYSETYNEVGLAQSKLWQPGTLCITIAANIADTAILKIPACFPDSIIGFLPYRDKSETIFVKYCLDTLKLQIESISRGTTQDNLSVEKLRTIKFKRIALPIQRKIAAILSAYDELIENNNRRIAILEKMAEEIYREWFVRLRFPGHEKVKVVKGVPEGWEVKKVGQIGKVVTGKTPPTNNQSFYNGEYPFIKTPDMHGNLFILKTEETLSADGMHFQASQTIPQGSVCVSCIGTGGIVSATTEISQTNQQINSVIPFDEKTFYWTFFSLKSLKEMIQMFGTTGTTMTNLSKGKFSKLPILYPGKNLIHKYNEIVSPIMEQIIKKKREIINLKSTRDLLLPRLISGKLDVENLDIAFPPGMEEERS